MNSSGARNPASWPLLLTLFSAMVLVTYFPVLTGKVPLPSHLVLQYPAWVGTEKPTPTPVATIGDLITFAYPSRLFASRTIQQLKLPLWNPYISSGVPFVADAQSAVFYPLNILGYVMPMATAWSLGLMLRLFLAAAFMALFAHSIGASRTGSVVAATIFGWCGFNTAWQGYAMGDAAIWLPLMCYAVHRLSTSSSSKYLALAAFAFSMPMLAGHPETAAHLCLAVVVFAIVVQTVPAIGLPNQTGFVRRMTVAGCLALGIAAIQMLPTVEWVGQIVHNLYSEWPTLPLSQALGVVSRDIQHGPNSAAIAIPEAASYVGMLSLLIAPFAAFHSNRRYVIALAIVAVLAFTAAFGVPPTGWIVTHTPLLKAIKNQRLILVASFGIASLAGLGVSVLQQESLTRKHRRTAAAIVTGALGVGLGLVYALQRTTTFRVAVMQRPSFSRALLIVSAIAVITALSGRLRGRALSVSLGAIVAFDLVTFSYGYTTFSQPKNIFPPAPVFDFLAAHVDPNQYRIAGLSGAYTGNAQVAYRVAAADGYDIPLQRTWRFHEGLRVDGATPLEFTEDAILSSQDRRLDLLNVKYLVANTADPDFQRMHGDPRFANVFQKGYVAVFENKTVLPRAFAVPVSGIEVIPNSEAQLRRLKDPAFDPEHSVLISAPPVYSSTTEVPAGPFTSQIEAVEHDVNTATYRAKTSHPAMLVISQTYYPGWYATVDGKQAPVVAADLALTGVFIPPGTHDVRLYLNPLSFRVGTMLTVIAIICTVGLLAGGLIPRYDLPLLQPLAFGTGVAAVAAIAIIVYANPDLSASDRAADDVPRRQSVTLQFSNEVGVVTVPTPKLHTGYAQFKTDSLGTTGMALLQYEQGKVESEIAMSSNTPITDGSIPFRISAQSRTAMILVNTANNEVHIDLSADSDPRQRSITIPAKDKLTVNLDEPPLSIGSPVGTLTWKSTGPLAVSAVETFTDATHPFLMAQIPVSTAAGLKKESVFIPFWNGFDGVGELVLVNPTDRLLAGNWVRYTASGERISQGPYSITPHTNSRIPMTSLGSGWIQVVPSGVQATPDATLFLLPNENEGASLVSIVGEPATMDATVHIPGLHAGVIRIILANPQPTRTRITLPSATDIPPFNMTSDAIVSKGTIRVRSQAPIALAIIRSRFVSGKEYAVSSYPLRLSPASVFAHFAMGGLFTTEFHLFPPDKTTVRGVLQFFDDDGQPTEIAVRDR